MRIALCQMNKTDSGYTIRYPEAVQREHPMPSAVGAMDDDQIEVMVEMQLASGDVEQWNEHQLDERREYLCKRLQAIRAKFSTRTRKVWMIEMREWSIPVSVGGIPWDNIKRVLVEADKAHEQLMLLIRSGMQFVGPLQPTAIIPAGPPSFG